MALYLTEGCSLLNSMAEHPCNATWVAIWDKRDYPDLPVGSNASGSSWEDLSARGVRNVVMSIKFFKRLRTQSCRTRAHTFDPRDNPRWTKVLVCCDYEDHDESINYGEGVCALRYPFCRLPGFETDGLEQSLARFLSQSKDDSAK